MSTSRRPADIARRSAKGLRARPRDAFRRETFALPRKQARENSPCGGSPARIDSARAKLHAKQWVARQITRARRRARSRVSAHGEPPASPGYLRRASDGLACAHPADRVDSPFVGGLPVQPTVGPLLCEATVKAD